MTFGNTTAAEPADQLTTYDDVNGAWGGQKLPPITAAKSAKYFKRLVAKFGGRKMRLPRYAHRVNRSWAAPEGTQTWLPRLNGLPRMVHDASHWVFRKLHPTFKTHSAAHAAVEKAMIEHVIAQGWHLPKPSPTKPTKDEARAAELAKVQASIKRWTTKAKRAATALRKLRAKERRLG